MLGRKESEMVRRMKADSQMSWLEQRELILSKPDSVSERVKRAASGCLELPSVVAATEDVSKRTGWKT